MECKVKWRTFWLMVLVVISVMTLVPSFVERSQLPRWFSGLFDKKIQYGLDLQGGLHIVYSIDLDKAVDDKATELKRDMEAQLEELGMKGRVSTPSSPLGAVSVILEDRLPAVAAAHDVVGCARKFDSHMPWHGAE